MHSGFPGGLDCKESTCDAGDPGLIPGQKDPLEEEMATHSSILAWRIPWTEEPGGLQSMGSQRVRFNWAINISSTCAFTHVLLNSIPIFFFLLILQTASCDLSELLKVIQTSKDWRRTQSSAFTIHRLCFFQPTTLRQKLNASQGHKTLVVGFSSFLHGEDYIHRTSPWRV